MVRDLFQGNIPQFSAGMRKIAKNVSQNVAVFWDVGPYCLVEIDRRFRGPSFLHHKGGRRLC
jgi:hypothetical protein